MMFQRFVDASRQMIVLAQEHARALNHNYIGTEHILLGMLDQEGSTARRILDGLGLDAATLREAVLQIATPGEDEPGGYIPFTPRAKSVLEASLRGSVQLGDNFIGPEHILLGLTTQPQGVAGQVLTARGVDEAAVRGAIDGSLRATGTDGPQPQAQPAERAAGPLCPGCGRSLAETLVTRSMQVPHDGEPGHGRVTIAYCEACGYTVSSSIGDA